MFRHLVRLGQHGRNVARFDPLFGHKTPIRYGNQFIKISRQFTSEMTAGWPEAIKNFLSKEHITEPTLIQEKTLPIVMENKNLVGIARTGSGKTLAFVIPAIMKIIKEQGLEKRRGAETLPTCLVLAPTRELATQTADVLKKFNNIGIRSLVLVGGASRNQQLRDLSYRDHNIYVATPGRLIDLMECEQVDLSSIKYLVLDEADRMLDMGFEPQIRRIIAKISKNRQTLMWSATWPKEIQSLANEFLGDYEYVAVDSEELKANPNIKQVIELCDGQDKFNKLLDHIENFKQEIEQPRILIFVNTKRMADRLMVQLIRNKHRTISMHSDKKQNQREAALKLFKTRYCNIMVATDVAARGLDINDISHVVNYDFPTAIEDYIHRIGRTARHEKKGVSLSFITSADINIVDKLVKVLRETNQEVPEWASRAVVSRGRLHTRLR